MQGSSLPIRKKRIFLLVFFISLILSLILLVVIPFIWYHTIYKTIWDYISSFDEIWSGYIVLILISIILVVYSSYALTFDYFGKNIWKYLKGCLFVIFSLAVMLMIIVAAVNIFDIQTDQFNINPSPVSNYKIVYLSYPSMNAQLIDAGANNTVRNLPLLTVEILLQYNGYLTEKKQINVTALGFVYGDGKKEIVNNFEGTDGHNIYIGFEGATSYNESETDYVDGAFPINLYELQYEPSSIGYFKKGIMKNFSLPVHSITWEMQGDYYPYITICYANNTIQNVRFEDYKIHVSGSDIEQQEKYSRINTSLTIVLFFFSLIASIELLSRFFFISFGSSENNPKNAENNAHGRTQDTTTTEYDPTTERSTNPPVKQNKKTKR